MLPYLQPLDEFPPTDSALTEPDGLLCFGGDLSVERLIKAYSNGIFPWYSKDEPIMWWSPWQRMVLKPEQFHLSKSLKKHLNKSQPVFHLNRNFEAVINHCATIPRQDDGTWIHPEMIGAYIELFKAGYAFSLEVEVNDELVGGIYGVKAGEVYCGESMFSLKTNGSKMAMYGLCQYMLKNDIKLLDCQIHNPHLESLGARIISRKIFNSFLSNNK